MKKILVIEDTEHILTFVLDVLGSEGYECHGAPDGEEGLVLFEKVRPDLVICDISMPGMSGYDVLDVVQASKTAPDTPFIFLTAFDSHEATRKGMKLGADDYLTKPVTPEDLIDAAAARLKKRETVRKKHRAEVQKTKEELHHNLLTGLPDRFVLDARCNEVIQKSSDSSCAAVLMIKIDHLRNVNEAFGREGGDYVIQEFANHVQKAIRREDSLFHGKSDCFTVVAPGIGDEQAAGHMLRRIQKAVSVVFQGQVLAVTCSVGVSFYRAEERITPGDIKKILDQAEIALHFARDGGGNCFEVFQPKMKKEAAERLKLEGDLYHAISKNELSVFYQPLVEIKSGQICGMEALIRWQHPKIGFVSPLSFIPLAEANGLILDIGRWVLQTACMQASLWKKNGHDLKVSVNFSGRQLEHAGTAEVIKKILNDSGCSPENLEAEITESLLMTNVDETISLLKIIKAKGISIAVDDFGTGYSSLAYLRLFPVDKIKIDRSFVRDLSRQSKEYEIVKTIIHMAHSLKLKVVAEGVETAEQLQILEDLDADIYQGYLFSRPVPAEEFEKLLSAPPKT